MRHAKIKKKLQQMASNNLSGIEFRDIIMFYEDYTK